MPKTDPQEASLKLTVLVDGEDIKTLDKLKGSQGDKGDTGPQGPRGEMGLLGYAGPRGTAGPMGPAGSEGPQGRVGPTGPCGEDGSVPSGSFVFYAGDPPAGWKVAEWHPPVWWEGLWSAPAPRLIVKS